MKLAQPVNSGMGEKSCIPAEFPIFVRNTQDTLRILMLRSLTKRRKSEFLSGAQVSCFILKAPMGCTVGLSPIRWNRKSLHTSVIGHPPPCTEPAHSFAKTRTPQIFAAWMGFRLGSSPHYPTNCCAELALTFDILLAADISFSFFSVNYPVHQKHTALAVS
jgi:hypothetical protein